MRTNRILSLLLIIVLIFTMTSCTKKDEKTAEPTDKPANTESEEGLTPESTEIVFWGRTTDPEDSGINAFIIKYPEYNVDITTTVSNPFATQDISIDLQRLAGAIASDDQPDLFLGYMAPIEAYYSNLFMPIHDYLTVDPEFNFETFESNFFHGMTFNGKVYFAPTALKAPLIMYNKDLFENAGLDPNKTPKTWSEFLEYCEKLVKYDQEGKAQSIGCNFIDWNEWNIVATGKQYTDETGLNININTQDYINILEFYRSMNDIYGGAKMLPTGVKFSIYEGNIGMEQGDTDGIVLLPYWAGDKFDYGIFEMPRPDDSDADYLPFSANNPYCIPRKAKNPKGGWKVMTFLLSDYKYDEAVGNYNWNPNKCIFAYIGHLPTREKVYNEFKDLIPEENWEIMYLRDEIMAKANVPVYRLAVNSQFNIHIRNELPKVINRQTAPKDMLDNTQAYISSLLKDFKKQKEEEKWIFKDDGTVIMPSED